MNDVNDTFELTQLKTELTADEGKRLFPYVDTSGKLTIGIGHNLTDDGISEAICDQLFASDVSQTVMELDHLVVWWRTLDAPRQRVMINLCFNMGAVKLTTFTTFLGYMKVHDYAGAAEDLKGTLWYGEVGGRGPRMVSRLLAGAADAA